MKKMIQMFSVLSLLLVFAAVSAKAQAEYGSEVEVPFSFTVGEHSYEAGKYVVKLNKSQSGFAALSISDPRTGTFQQVFTQRNGEGASDDVKLVFNTVNGEKVLSSVITPGGGFAINLSRRQRESIGRDDGRKTEFVGTSSSLF